MNAYDRRALGGASDPHAASLPPTATPAEQADTGPALAGMPEDTDDEEFEPL